MVSQKKRSDLLAEMTAEIKGKEQGSRTNPVLPDDIPVATISPAKAKAKNPKATPWYPASRKLHREMKQLALDEDTSMNALLHEGVKLLFEKRGKRYEDFLED